LETVGSAKMMNKPEEEYRSNTAVNFTSKKGGKAERPQNRTRGDHKSNSNHKKYSISLHSCKIQQCKAI
jgi:hypothetical protein